VALARRVAVSPALEPTTDSARACGESSRARRSSAATAPSTSVFAGSGPGRSRQGWSCALAAAVEDRRRSRRTDAPRGRGPPRRQGRLERAGELVGELDPECPLRFRRLPSQAQPPAPLVVVADQRPVDCADAEPGRPRRREPDDRSRGRGRRRAPSTDYDHTSCRPDGTDSRPRGRWAAAPGSLARRGCLAPRDPTSTSGGAAPADQLSDDHPRGADAEGGRRGSITFSTRLSSRAARASNSHLVTGAARP
jgi:hypothetical protein